MFWAKSTDITPLDARAETVQDLQWAASTGAAPLEACVERWLLRPLRRQVALVDAGVVQHFLEHLHLLRRLQVLQRYLLFGESRLVEAFVVEAMDRFTASPGLGLPELAL